MILAVTTLTTLRPRRLIVAFVPVVAAALVLSQPSIAAPPDPRTKPVGSAAVPQVTFLQSDRGHLYSAAGSGSSWSLKRSSLPDLTPDRSVDLGLEYGDVKELAVGNGFAMVLSETRLTRVDLETFTVVGRFRANSMIDMAYDPDHDVIYGTWRQCCSRTYFDQQTQQTVTESIAATFLDKFDATNGNLLARWKLSDSPGQPMYEQDYGNRMAVTADGSRLFVGLNGESNVLVLDTSSGCCSGQQSSARMSGLW